MSTALKFKKGYYCAALLSLSASLPLYGLGLGKMRIFSALNQPFSAEIDLIDSQGVNQSSMKASVAEAENFARLGLNESFSLTLLNFKIEKNKLGKTVIKINSEERITEPTIDLLVDLAWVDGQMFRLYTVLLDPPGYQLQSSIAQGGTTYYKNASDAYPIAFNSTKTTITTPTQSNENVWQLAQRYKSSSLTLPQVVLAVVGANPDGFDAGNLNGLKAGTRLTIPSAEQINEVPAQLAEEEVKAHDRAWPKKEAIRHVIAPPYINNPRLQDRQEASVTATIPVIPKLALLQTTEGAPPPLFAKEAIAPTEDLGKQAKTSQHDSIRADISLNTNALESIRQSNDLLKEQLALIQEQNKTLQQQLDKRDKEVELIKEQIQVMMKQRQGIASQASYTEEKEPSSFSAWIVFLLLASGAGGAAYWYFLRPQEDRADNPLTEPQPIDNPRPDEALEKLEPVELPILENEIKKEDIEPIEPEQTLIQEEIVLPDLDTKDETKQEEEPVKEVILEFESTLHEFTNKEAEPLPIEEDSVQSSNHLEFEPNLASAKSRVVKEEAPKVLDEEQPALTDSSNIEETADPLKSKQAFDTLMDLARTYLSMEDYESAKHALEEVQEHGTRSRKTQASELLLQIQDRKD